ncbi:hypothetical protein ACH5RR_031460 [Cinchona calisaya]|uniref:Uncharacterized protein n=1 Tax=Cinchona calisaya TaxID=153742 RepID=A0ABD2YGD4_9GENT
MISKIYNGNVKKVDQLINVLRPFLIVVVVVIMEKASTQRRIILENTQILPKDNLASYTIDSKGTPIPPSGPSPRHNGEQPFIEETASPKPQGDSKGPVPPSSPSPGGNKAPSFPHHGSS